METDYNSIEFGDTIECVKNLLTNYFMEAYNVTFKTEFRIVSRV